ncbi:MAG: septum site-determining protein MinD [Clostridia bacterium]
MIVSGKGGVGKTTFTANLGIALSKLNKSVVVVEGDIGLNNLDVALNLEDHIIYDMYDVVQGKCNVQKSLVSYNENLFLMPSISLATSSITSKQFFEITNELKNIFEYVLIDCPAGIEGGFHRAVIGGDEAIIVCTPTIASIRDAYKVSRVLSSYNNIRQSLVVNRLISELVADNKMLSPTDIANATKLPLLGVIPEEQRIALGSTIDKITKKCNVIEAYDIIANNIENGEKKIYNFQKDYSNIFHKVRSIFK